MGLAKDFYHEEICEMAAQAEAEDLSSFYGGPDASHEAFRFFVDQEARVADSYPHDRRWRVAVANIETYHHGHMTKTGAAVP